MLLRILQRNRTMRYMCLGDAPQELTQECVEGGSPRTSFLLAEDWVQFNPAQAQRPQTKEFQHPNQKRTGIPSPVERRASASLELLSPSQPSVSTTPVKAYHLHQTTPYKCQSFPKTCSQAHPEMVLCQISGYHLAKPCCYTKLKFPTCSQSQELEGSAEEVRLWKTKVSQMAEHIHLETVITDWLISLSQ